MVERVGRSNSRRLEGRVVGWCRDEVVVLASCEMEACHSIGEDFHWPYWVFRLELGEGKEHSRERTQQ